MQAVTIQTTERTPRGYIGVAVRSGIEFIEQKGLTAKVRADASPAALKVMDKPPSMLAWQDSPVLDELETLLAKHGGRDACVDLGLYAGRKLGSGLIKPVLSFALQIFGSSPNTVFANLDRFYPIVTRGLSYGYEPISAHSGAIILTAEGPQVPKALFDVIRGNLAYIYELAKATGTIDPPQIRTSDATQTVVCYIASWT